MCASDEIKEKVKELMIYLEPLDSEARTDFLYELGEYFCLDCGNKYGRYGQCYCHGG